MSEGLAALHHPRIELARIDISAEGKQDIAYMPFYKTKQYSIIEKELKDYQEIKEIAKHYNWDDITGEIFNIKTDKKYRDLFDSAIINIQKDYRKARALEIIINKEINIHSLLLHLKRFDNPDGYNALVGAKYQITQEEFNFLKKELL